MGETASRLTIIQDSESKDFPDIKTTIFDTFSDELIIGLCGPIGTDIHSVSNVLSEVLTQKYGYRCKIIKLSDLVRVYAKSEIGSDEMAVSKFTVYQKLINGGNSLRQAYSNSILAELAINEIAVQRELSTIDQNYKSERVCYIIDSLKNKEELELFKLIYRDIFWKYR